MSTFSQTDQESLAQWMRDNGYRESTVVYTLREVRRASRLWHATGEIPESLHSSLRRFATYLRKSKKAPGAFDKVIQGDQGIENVRAVRQGARRRKKPAKSFGVDDWARLQEELATDDSPEGIVLLLMATTGHRVGDILRIHRSDLVDARKTGVLLLERKGGDLLEVPLAGAQAAWDKLFRYWKGSPNDQVSDWVCPDCGGGPEAGSGAYKRVQRHLQRLGKQLGLDGRVHLHRMRRTVGVRALEMTRDVHLVSQLLGHQSISSTEGYVDELRRDDVAELQKKLQRKQ